MFSILCTFQPESKKYKLRAYRYYVHSFIGLGWARKLFVKFPKSQIRNSCVHSDIANPQISYECQSANAKPSNFYD